MALRGCFHINRPATDYEIGYTITRSLSSNVGTPMLAQAKSSFYYGVESGGFVCDINQRDDGTGIETWELDLTTQWGNYSTSGSGVAPVIRHEIDNVVLTVDLFCRWTFEFTEYRLYFDNVLEHTIAGGSHSGLDFDLRSDTFRFYTRCLAEDDEEGIYTCPAGAIWDCSGAVPSFARSNIATCAITAYWTYRELSGSWQFDDLDIKTIGFPATECVCIAPGEAEILLPYTSSQEIFLESFFLDGVSVVPDEIDCDCTDGNGTGFIRFYVYETTRTYQYSRTEISCMPITSGLYDHVETAEIICEEDSDTETNTIDYNPDTFCSFDRHRELHQTVVFCYTTELIGPEPCYTSVPGANDNCDVDFDNSHCCVVYNDSSTWVELSCLSGVEGIDSTHNRQTAEYHVALVSFGDVYVINSQFSSPIDQTSAQVTDTGDCSYPSIEYSENGFLYVAYRDGNQVKYKLSRDKGETWDSETNMFTGLHKYPRVASVKDGTLVFTAFKYISGTTGPGYLYVIPFGAGDISLPTPIQVQYRVGAGSLVPIEVEDEVFDVSYGNDKYGQLVLICKLSGNSAPNYFTTHDYGKTYREIA